MPTGASMAVSHKSPSGNSSRWPRADTKRSVVRAPFGNFQRPCEDRGHTGCVRSIREVVGRELRWIRAGRGHAYELRAGDEIVGSLRWEHSSLASGETADERWTFNREGGFWHPRIRVKA